MSEEHTSGAKEREFAETLIRWYHENRRELPWRVTGDPYLIWISEIILQQTRVVQGMDYYARLTARFPDVCSLAAAEEDEVLKYWQGLGYYSRARNLHRAAKEVVSRFGGVFPSRYEDVLSLPGIGAYTAAAICSFAWNGPYAVVDGNVYRVLARVFGVDVVIDSTEGKRFFTALAQRLQPSAQSATYNQAIMDFGAVQCVVRSPNCAVCPLMDSCAAYASDAVAKLPVTKVRTAVKARYFNYFHIHYGDKTLLVQRRAKDIWQNLYEFPMIETDRDMEWEQLVRTEAYRRLFDGVEGMQVGRVSQPFKHVLSHRVIYARFVEMRVERLSDALADCLAVDGEAFERYALPRLLTLYLESLPSSGS